MSDILAGVFKKVLAEHHSLCGLELTVGDVTVPLTDQEFEAVWEALDELEEDFTVRLAHNTESKP